MTEEAKFGLSKLSTVLHMNRVVKRKYGLIPGKKLLLDLCHLSRRGAQQNKSQVG